MVFIMDIRKQLEKEADKKYQKFSASLIPNINNVLGVRLPVLRKLAKELYVSGSYDDIFELLKTPDEIEVFGKIMDNADTFNIKYDLDIKMLLNTIKKILAGEYTISMGVAFLTYQLPLILGKNSKTFIAKPPLEDLMEELENIKNDFTAEQLMSKE